RIPGTPSLRGLNYLLHGMNAPVVGPVISYAADQIYNRKPIEFSLLEDLRQRKQTEVNYINGEFIRLGESLQMKAPVHRTVASIARELEARGVGSYFSRDEVIRRFQSLN